MPVLGWLLMITFNAPSTAWVASLPGLAPPRPARTLARHTLCPKPLQIKRLRRTAGLCRTVSSGFSPARPFYFLRFEGGSVPVATASRFFATCFLTRKESIAPRGLTLPPLPLFFPRARPLAWLTS